MRAGLNSILTFMVGLFLFQSAFAGNGSLMYQARILKPDGMPLETDSNFQFTIRAPNGCILWSELHTNVSMVGSHGAVSAEIGSGTYPNQVTGTTNFADVFANTGTLTGLQGCGTGTTYTPNSNDDRTLTVSFNSGTGPNILPDMAIRSVPFAQFSNLAKSTLQLQGTDVSATPPTAGQMLSYNNSTHMWEPTTLSGTGTVTSVDLIGSSIFNITGGPVTTAGSFNLQLASQSGSSVLASPVGGGAGIPSFRALSAADITGGTFAVGQIPNLDASKITTGTLATAVLGTIPTSILSGTLSTAQVGNLDASQITSGTLNAARLPLLDASQVGTGTFATSLLGTIPASIISGTLSSAAIGNIDASQVTTGTFATSRLGNLDASIVTSGTFNLARIPAMDAARIPNLDASKITTGTLAAAVGGTGLVPQAGNANQVYGVNATGTGTEFKTIEQGAGVTVTNSNGTITIGATGSGGTVTNVGLTGSSMFSITGSPVSTFGTMNIDWASVASGNKVLASPDGSAGTPSFRSLTASDITGGTLATAQLGIVPAANGGTGLNGGSAANGSILIGNGAGYTLATMQVANGILQTLASGSVALTTNATNLNTASTLVERDPSGNFSAGAVDMASVGIRGNTTGVATLNAPASFTNYTLTLPSTVGSPGQVLATNGTGALSWSNQTSSPWLTATNGLYYNSGSVAIGRTNPAADLDVNGVIRATQICDETGGNCKTISGGWGAGGSVTNVGLSMPSIFTVTNSPIGTAGTFGVTLNNAAQNSVFAGPTSGSGTPSFRILDAADIGTGTFATARLGTIPASIISGTLATSAIGNVDASQITSGTLATARLGSLDASIITSGSFALARIPTMDAAHIPNLDASKITAGTLSASVGGTGLVPAAGNANQVYGVNGTGTGNEFKTLVQGSGVTITHTAGSITIAATGSGGSVTNVGLTGNSMFAITGSSVSTFGTFNLDWASVASGNKVLASPNGAAGTPSFRSLTASDITGGTLATAQLGIVPAANGGTGLNGGSAANGSILIGNGAGYTLATMQISNGIMQTLGAGSVALTTNATNLNTASTLVERDPSGNFSAGAVDVASIGIRGNTTGVATLNAPASFTNYSLTLPSSVGSPGQVLSTNGTSALNWINLPSSQWQTATNGLYYNSGSVAIGRTNPAADLDVNGTIRATQICDETGGNCKTISGGWGSGGSVTNVGLSMPSIFTVTNSPIGTFGTFGVTLNNAAQNTVFAGPTSGSGTPSFRILDAADIGAGTFATARLGTIPASIISGTLATSAIGNINASQITSGTLATARLGSLDASIITSGSFALARIPTMDAAHIPDLDASKITTGTLSASVGGTGLVPAAGNANQIYGVNAAGTGNEYKTLVQGSNVTITNSAGTITIAATASGGSVNVGLTGNSMFNITGSPVTSNGTMNLDWASQTANKVLAAPNGSTGAPAFRSLVAADIASGTFATSLLGTIPTSILSGTLATSQIGNLDASVITSGTFAMARLGIVPAANGGTGLNGGSAGNGRLLIGNGSGYTLATLNISNGLSQTLASGSISLTTNGTNLNTGSTLVERDSSGNFSAGAVDMASVALRGSSSGTATFNVPASFSNYTLTWPANVGSPGQVLTTNGTSGLSWTTPSAGAGVTNVGLSGNSMFSITGSPVTSVGTMNIDWASQSANQVLASPNGSAGAPAFRSLVAADITSGTFATAQIGNISASQVTTGTFATARLGSLDASIVTSGTFATARLGTLPAANLSGTLATAQLGIVPAANGGTGLNGGSAANGRILIGNGSGYTMATLNISNGLSQTLASGSISLTTNATNANTASAIVSRDASGDFSAGDVDLSSIVLRGSSSGTATFKAPATVTTYSLTLPTSAGSNGQALVTNGSNTLSWLTVPGNGSTFLAANGSAAAPGFAFNSDQDVGLFHPGTNSLGISVGGTERVRIASNGKVGIGTTNPAAQLDVNGEIKVGNSGATCTASTVGQLRYNTTSKTMEFCDGSAWTAMSPITPIGSIVAWHKSFANTPALPSGWAECNGQVLSDSLSPYNGQTLPKLNSATQDGSTNSGMFLRGGTTSGTYQADATAVNGLSATTTAKFFGSGSKIQTDGDEYTAPSAATVTLASTDTETHPPNMTVVWIIRVH